MNPLKKGSKKGKEKKDDNGAGTALAVVTTKKGKGKGKGKGQGFGKGCAICWDPNHWKMSAHITPKTRAREKVSEKPISKEKAKAVNQRT